MSLTLIRTAVSHILTSRAIIDQIELPNTQFSKYKKGLDDMAEWVNLFKTFDPKKPHTWVSTGLKFASKVSVPKRVVEPSKRSLITRFLDSQGLVKVDQYNALTFYQDILQKNFKDSKVVHADDGGVLRVLPVEGCEPFYFYELETPATHRGRDYSYLPFLPDAVRHTERRKVMNEKLCDLFWSDKKHLKVAIGSEFLDYTVLAPSERAYQGVLVELYDKLNEYLTLDVRRVLLFNGPPGTGKSTLALNLAEALSKRTVVITHSTLEWISEDDWEYFLNMVQPEMIVVDDIDRLASLLQKKLFLFEEKTCDVPLVVLTSNHIEWLPDAFKRPGRIDQIIEMETPGIEVRKQVLLKIAELEGVTVPEDRIDILDKIHERHSGAYLVELFRRVKVEGWDYKIPAYDRTFQDLSATHRNQWNEGPRKDVPTIEDLGLDDFDDFT